MRIRKHSLFAFCVVIAVTVVLSLGVWVGLDRAVDRVTKNEAESRAAHWTQYFYQNLGNLEGLIRSGKPTETQAKLIDAAVQFGDVFRFKVFRPDGTVALVSDEYRFINEGHTLSEVNEKALAVFQTGTSDITTYDGRLKDNRPDTYVEAYVQITDGADQKIGVVEVYLDQTNMAANLRSGFSWIAYALPFLCALIYLVPSLAFLKKGAIANAEKARAERLSKYDVLTGLYNRRSFTLFVEKFFGGNGDDTKPVGMIFIDIDDFKQVNDSYGHEGGDAFLRATARAIEDQLPADGIASRFGGDEFVVCLPGVSKEQLNAIAEKILAAVSNGIEYKGKTIVGHVSAGTHLAAGSQDIEDVLHAADIAMYKAKESGKNTVTSYTCDMEQELKERQRIEKLLRQAVDGTGLELHYQPINASDSKAILGFEALLRLQSEDGTIIGPDQFIPLAEKLGLIKPIGNWVLEEAISNAKSWPEHMFVSVNLSPVQFEPQDLPSMVANLLEKYEFPAKRLELEVTESLLMGDDGSVHKQLEALKEMGISIAMDDFGTGYSSLSYLWKYKFDKLKIDRSFVLGYENDSETLKKIIETIVVLGHGIGMEVTAEGVENDTHIDALAHMDFDQLQGFYFGQPMDANEAARVISADTLNTIQRQIAAGIEPEQNVA
ncbi:bifunctional diguanylate cyclase/phosphodiesterase [Pararhizobium sp. IMCC21322]|uniref:putative bifunctional diguanylate cyclase/phosphodiesterase n=1 Tax=Pararhizobium sp. IMCC21322 TaxID=3067903 RepID=UPI002742962A|nr:bifunctional diguanylate cyclase/phosphodiesterase [Pararhizobium sp. IMCC21322]